MAYVIASSDVCIQGMERLRNQNEFILAAPVAREDAQDMHGVIQALHDDINSCDRPDDQDGEPFDYDEARRIVDHYVKSNWNTLSKVFASLDAPEGDGLEWEGCYFFLYITTNG